MGDVLRVNIMLEILKAGMSLTCIGRARDSRVDTVRLSHDDKAEQMLETYNENTAFRRVLHLKQRVCKYVH